MSVSIRINTLKNRPQDVIYKLEQHTISVTAIPWYEDAYITNASKQQLTHTDMYANGEYYIQQLSSMIPALVLDVQAGERVLDLCSAPGSKTTQIGEICNNQCEITANDISRERIFKLIASYKKQGITCINTSVAPGESFGRNYSDTFDKVLVDVPCSMGQKYASKNLKRLISRQRALLRSGFRSLKPYGTLIYSTCSPRIEENDKVIEWLLKKEPSASQEPIIIPNIPSEWVDGNTIRIYSSDNQNEISDFFIAKLTKTLLDTENRNSVYDK